MSEKTRSVANHEKRQDRRKESAEDFTPKSLVLSMLGKMEEFNPEVFTDPKKTILDPACGNGNFLVEVLKRKMKHTDPLQAISTIYGLDIFQDNITECRLRLLKVVLTCKKSKIKPDVLMEIFRKLIQNIVHLPVSQFPNGSLDYLALPKGETFDHYKTKTRCYAIMEQITKNKLLDGVSID